MIHPKDNITLPIFTTPFAFGYTDRVSFKVRHGQGAGRIDTDTLDGFFGNASIRQKSPCTFRNCPPDALCRLFEDARIQFVFPGRGFASRSVNQLPIFSDECSPR